MDRWGKGWLLGAVVIGLIGAWPGGEPRAQESTDPSVERIEEIVREYLLREPEVIYEALQELQRRQAELAAERTRQAVADNRQQLYDDPLTPVAGDPAGDVTLVEFFDYRCTYCRRVVSTMRTLLDDDPRLKVVFKELPVLGPDSVRAARAALASRAQDGYVPFHFALMTSTDLSEAGIRATARSVGLDLDRLEADMQAPEIEEEIERNYRLASALGIEGTPAFVIDDQLIPGAVDKARLEELISNARSAS